jgi:hypothetical protein
MAQQGGRTAEAALDRLLAKASTDSVFRFQLLHDTHAALASVGVKVPPGVTLKVVENSPTLVHLVLPPWGYGGRDLGAVVGARSGGWDTVPGLAGRSIWT